MRFSLGALVELLGPALLVIVVGLLATTASASNEVYFLNALVSVLVNAALPTDKTVFLPSVVYALVIVVLLLRPAGLFAWGRRAAVERV